MNLISKGERPSLFLRGYRALSPIRNRITQYLTRLTDDWIGRAYETRNEKLRMITIPICSEFRSFYRRMLSDLEAEVFLLTGLTVRNNQPLKTLYVGDKATLKFLIQSLYTRNSAESKPLGRCLAWKMGSIANQMKTSADLIILERSTYEKWVPNSGDWVRTPRWIRMVHRFEAGIQPNEMNKKLKALQRHNYQMVRKMQYSLEVSNQMEDAKFFYERMYLPSIEKRYGDISTHGSWDYYARMAKKGLILFSCLPGGERVAGSLVLPRNSVLYGVINGVLDGDEELRRNGALSSMYIFFIEYAIEHRFLKVDIGEVMPISTNGLFNHKRQWGFSPELSPWHTTDWLFWVPNASQTALHWLSENPFLPEFAQWAGSNIQPFFENRKKV